VAVPNGTSAPLANLSVRFEQTAKSRHNSIRHSSIRESLSELTPIRCASLPHHGTSLSWWRGVWLVQEHALPKILISASMKFRRVELYVPQHPLSRGQDGELAFLPSRRRQGILVMLAVLLRQWESLDKWTPETLELATLQCIRNYCVCAIIRVRWFGEWQRWGARHPQMSANSVLEGKLIPIGPTRSFLLLLSQRPPR